MNNPLKSLLFAVLLLATSAIHAVEFEGVNIPDAVTIEGSATQLQLNGVGMRTKFFFDIYIGALYVESKVKSRDAVQALKGPKRIYTHFLYGEVSKEKLVAGWNEGFENNNSSVQVEALSQRISQFNAMFPTLVKGDAVLIDVVPGKGTTVTIKGKVKGVIEGDDFGVALLDIWLGEEPADDDLKEAMLNL